MRRIDRSFQDISLAILLLGTLHDFGLALGWSQCSEQDKGIAVRIRANGELAKLPH